ncbi:SprB repeat-containing protein, partial [Flavipsychrobacter stenotrophus]
MNRKLHYALSRYVTIVVLVVVGLLAGSRSYAQTFTYNFEDATAGATTFSSNGYNFQIISNTGGPFYIQTGYAGFGWSGIASDDKFIDNDGNAHPGTSASFTISILGGVSTNVQGFWLYIADNNNTLQTSGAITIVGKNAGTTVFTASATSGWNGNNAVANGFTYIDMGTFGGANNSNTSVTDITITTATNINYVSLDAFSWKAGSASNNAPSFINGTSAALTVCQNAAATDIKSLLHVGDGDASQTETWTQQTAPSHGTLVFTGATASSGSSDITPGGTITYQPTAGYGGSDAFIVRVSDGTATDDIIINVTVPVISVSPSITICGNASTSLVATGASSYSWSPSSNLSASTGSSVVFTDPRTNSGVVAYTYSVTGTTGACSSTATVVVTVNQIVAMITKGNTTVCGATSVTLSTSGATSYSWSPAAGLSSTTAASVIANPGVSTIYTVVGVTGAACKVDTVAVRIAAPPSSAPITLGNTTCTGVSSYVSATATANATTNWFSASTGGSFLGTGDTLAITTPSAATDVYAQANADAAFSSTFDAGNGQSGAMFDITAINNVTIKELDVSMASAGATCTLYYRVGTMVGNNTSSTGWTSLGTYSGSDLTREMVLPTPILIPAGQTYGFYVNSNASVKYTNFGSAGSVFASNPDMSIVSGYGASSLFNATISGRMLNFKAIYNSSTFCSSPRAVAHLAITPSPTITLSGSSISIAAGATSVNLPYTGTTGSPTTYSIVYDATAHTAGFADVTNAAITATPLVLAVPVGAGVGTYNGTITMSNSSCSGTGQAFTIQLFNSNTSPTFVGSTTTLTVCKDAAATDIKSLLHVSDADASQTETWSQSVAPTHGTLTFSSATASSNSTDITPGGTITYQPTAGYFGTDAFTVQVSDGTATATRIINVTVTKVTTSVSAQTNVSCNSSSNGAATISASGGTAAYTFSWAPSGGSAATATGLAAGSYTVSVADANLCATTQTVTVIQPSAITSSVSAVTNVSCNGLSNGAATVSASGGTPGYTYGWAPSGGTAATATGLAAGTYTCTITDANSCTKTQTVTISQPNVLTSSVSAVTNVSCNGLSNGAATVSASGGTPGYTYGWAPSGGTAATATGLAAGTYTCTITDANSCTKTQTVTISQPNVLTSSVSAVTNVSCNGLSNGAATVSASGGTPGYTYGWAPIGGTAATATGLSAGTYTVTITDANSCTKNQTVTIAQPLVLTSSVSAVTNVSCNGLSNGAATVSASGGTPGYTYGWAPSGGTAATATGLAAGTYTCTITDANSCTKTQTVTVSQPLVLTSSVSAVTNVSCNGLSNGAATVSASGGTPGYTYGWAPSGGTAATATSLAAGTYTCTITDANSCTKTQTVTISQPLVLTSSVSAITNVSCNGLSNGAATISASGGTPGYTYGWAPSGGTAATATGLAAGTYTVTITDANSCGKTQTVTISQPLVLASSVSAQTNVSCNGLSNAAATVAASGGTPSYSFSWAPSGGTAATATGLAAGTYTVTITDANSCTKNQVVTISQPAVLTASISATTNVSCNGGSNGAATVAAGGGTAAYSYSWFPSGGTAATATGLTMGSYTVAVTDANSCATTATVSITEPIVLTASISATTNVSCNSGSNGSATVTAGGGTGTYTYIWTPSGGTGATASCPTAGNYTVTVKDANLCATTATVTVTQPSAITSNVSAQTNVDCNGNATGAATVTASGGTGTLDYSWVPVGGNLATATGLTAGTYTCTITDANTCNHTQTVTITQPAVLTASISATTNVSCNGGSNGAATVTAGGGTTAYAYSWTPTGGTGATATGFTAGTYTVQVTDAHLCAVTRTVTVTEPAVLTASISATTNVSCNGGSNGSATVAAGGGTGAYSYSWTPSGGTGATASGLAAGNYTVTVTDANNCTQTANTTITEPTAITGTITATTNVSCNGGNNGAATVTASGGTGSLTYSWALTGGTAATANNLVAGTYTVTIRDANLCTITKTTTITQPTAITSSVSAQTNVDCNGNATGAATVSASGGTGTLAYSWAPSGGTGATATGLTAGTYTCTITDDNLCVHTQTVTITQPNVLATTVSAQTNVTCHGGNNGAATVTPAGGTIPYDYSWSPIGGSAATGTGFAIGSYTCTITDGNGCMHDQVVAILEPALPVAAISGTTAICKDENADVIINGPAGTTVAYTINSGSSQNALMDANGADTINSGSLTANATYALVSITQGTCNYPSIGNAVITVKPFPTVDATTDQSICNGAVTTPVIFTGTVSGTLFTWTNDNTTTGIPAAGADSITSLTLTNNTTARIFSTIVVTPSANGCTGISDTFEIVSNPTPMLSSTLSASPVCNTTLFSYTPTSATIGTTFAWSRAAIAGISNVANNGNDDPNETLTNTTTDPIVVTYVYTLTANACSNTQNVTVTVQPTPMLSSTLTPAAICNNTTFNYAPTSATTGTVFNWSRAIVPGISNTIGAGTNDPNEVLTNTTVDPIVVTYVYTLTANSCSNTQNVTVTVQPTPMLTTTLTAAPVCNNTLFSYPAASATTGTVFNWSRAAVAGISNTAATGTNNPNETLTNTTADPIVVTYVYTLTANSCNNIQNVTVTVQPTPMLTSTLTAAPVCNTTLFTYMPTSATTGTVFTWSRAVVAGISNTIGAGTNDPNEVLTNTTTDPIAVTYVYTLTANSCSNVENVTVTVQPTPMLTTTLTAAPVCNNTLFSYPPASATTGTAFAWSRAVIAGISNTATTGTNNPNETLTNTTADPIVVTYVYTLTANSCTNVQSVDVTVQPTPMLTTTLTAAPVCNTTLFTYVPASATVGTTFAWSRAVVAGISNTATTGTNNPNETLTNTTADPIVVTYVYTLTENSCDNVQNVTVTVQPTPMLSSTLTPAAICNNTTFNYAPTSATTGTVFNWSRAIVAGISNTIGAGTNDPNEVLTNTTTDPIVVTYVYTLTANSCSHTENVTVTVNPTPLFTSAATVSPLCDSTLLSYTPTSATAGTTYSWSRATVSGISNAAGTGINDPMEYLVNTTPDPINVIYVYTLTANGCNNVQSVTTTVYPRPRLSTTLTPAGICDNSNFSYNPASLTAGTIFHWSRAAVAGISNAAAAGTDNPNEVLMNITTDSVVVIYIDTLEANGCINTQPVTVSVYPTPILSSTHTPAAVCDSSVFNYTPTSATPATAFTWSRATVAGISNAANTGTGNPMEYLVNTTPDPISVLYIYTLTANGCTNTNLVTVVVNPKPLLTTTLTPAAICDSTLFSYTPASATVGTVFTWSRATVAGIANTAAAGSNDPMEYLDNTTANPLTVVYIDTLFANGCYNTQAVSVVVNSTPMLSSGLNGGAVCNNTTFNYTPTSATTGTTFAWTRATVTGITNAAGSGIDNPAETLNNSTNHPVAVIYIYTLTANGCSNTQTVTMTVNPTPVLSGFTTATVCSSTPLVYTPGSTTTGTTFAWTRAVVAGISNAAATSTG